MSNDGPGVLLRGEARQLRRVGGRRGIQVEPVVAGGHGVDVPGGEVERVQQRLAGLLLVAVGVSARHEALVAPPEVHPRPVDVVAPGVPAAAARTATPCAARQGDVHGAAGSAGFADLADESRRDALRERRGSVADDDPLRGDLVKRHAAPALPGGPEAARPP